MTTLIIEGGNRWLVPQSDTERARMASYVRRVGDLPARCHDCAFRAGTDANSSQLVLDLVEGCLLSGNTFCCHHGDDETRPCVGFVALRESFGGGAT